MPVSADIYYHFYEGSAEGQRPPVLLLHGAAGDHLSWPAEVRRIPGYRVYALDLPGHGKSGGRGIQTIPAFAQAVIDWLESVHLHSAVFIGHSMGGAIALQLALDHPDHVLGLGLIGSGARLRVNPELIDHASNQTTFHNAIRLIVEWSFSTSASPIVTAAVTRRMDETRAGVLYSDLLACNDFSVVERLGQIHKPTLVLVGNEDRMTPLRNSQFLAQQITGAELRVLSGAGHMAMLEQPKATAEAVAEFLTGINY